MTNVEKALKWWRGLSTNQQIKLKNKFFPDKPLLIITTSSMRIEQMFLQINKEK